MNQSLLSRSRIAVRRTSARLAAVLLLSAVSLGAVNATPVTFTVETADGSVDAESLRGQVVLVDFWASWCTPCRKSFPWMNEMKARYGDDGLTIIAINLDKDRALAEQFLADLSADFTIGYDPEAILAKQFDVIGMPSAYLIGRDGEVLSSHVGFRTGHVEDYENAIREALGGTL